MTNHPSDDYTREGFLQLLHERLAAAHLAGRDSEGFPASSLKLLTHYFDQLTAGKPSRDSADNHRQWQDLHTAATVIVMRADQVRGERPMPDEIAALERCLEELGAVN